MSRAALACVALAAALSACALTSKSSPAPVHYFTPESLDAAALSGSPAEPPTASAPSGRRLRVGRVTSSAHLRTKIVYRRAANELGTYDDERWTEAPEAYLRRALERALFDARGLERGYAGPMPVLDIELLAFEEVQRGSSYAGRVDVAFVLHDDRDVLASGRVTKERTAASTRMSDVVAAVGGALDDATADIAARVERRVPKPTAGER